MPDDIAPGVYVEETSARARPIDGVPTSITGFAGVTSFGPVAYPGGPTIAAPPQLTSTFEFEEQYGGGEPLQLDALTTPWPSYTAHAARAFFQNGGQRLHVVRVFAPRIVGGNEDWGVASHRITVGSAGVTWRARWPGALGNVTVETIVARSDDVAVRRAAFGGIVQAEGATHGALVEITRRRAAPAANAPLSMTTLAVVEVNAKTGRQHFRRRGRTFRPASVDVIRIVEAQVHVHARATRDEIHVRLGAHPSHARYLGGVLSRDTPAFASSLIWLDIDDAAATGTDATATLLLTLQGAGAVQLQGGHDGALPSPAHLRGTVATETAAATGLEALATIDDVGIVALPDAGAYPDADASREAAVHLIEHAERWRHRFAVIDAPQHADLDAVRDFRRHFDSARAALYFPWVEVVDPLSAQPLPVPPSGFVSGVYARCDTERGVEKAPANEVIAGIMRIAVPLTAAEQELLLGDGINPLRHVPGRGDRIWGARTLSADPEWKYINVRRLVSYLEHSIELGTQWAVFEPNGEQLWQNVRQAIEQFLFSLWSTGALTGQTPVEAYFVRCDRTTMTQADLDAGRLVCLIGIAPLRPAEFTIVRIAQWTSDARRPPDDP